MNYLVCIDDTDMPGTKGTGWLVQELCEQLWQMGQADASPISRHQLFVHEDIPYTSHNSSMCFELSADDSDIEKITTYMAGFLEIRCEKGSDPGLCIARLGNGLDSKALITYGKNAKKKVSTKHAAYVLARQTGIHLSEHGGTGQGVVGAVAGIGLRLSGDDGRYRGWYHLGRPGDVVSVDKLCKYDFIDELVTRDGKVLAMDENVHIGSEKTKIVRMGSRQALMVVENKEYASSGLAFRTITKKEAKSY